MELSDETRNYLARKWWIDYVGAEPSPAQQHAVAQDITARGVDLALAAVYDGKAAQAFRAKRGW